MIDCLRRDGLIVGHHQLGWPLLCNLAQIKGLSLEAWLTLHSMLIAGTSPNPDYVDELLRKGFVTVSELFKDGELFTYQVTYYGVKFYEEVNTDRHEVTFV